MLRKLFCTFAPASPLGASARMVDSVIGAIVKADPALDGKSHRSDTQTCA